MDQRHKRATVGALVLLTCLVQVWTIARAVAPAQDCVRYLIVAQGIERAGLVATLREQPEQPLFSAIAWAMHRLLSASGWLDSGGWAICLQAAAVALVLSVIPVYAGQTTVSDTFLSSLFVVPEWTSVLAVGASCGRLAKRSHPPRDARRSPPALGQGFGIELEKGVSTDANSVVDRAAGPDILH